MMTGMTTDDDWDDVSDDWDDDDDWDDVNDDRDDDDDDWGRRQR